MSVATSLILTGIGGFFYKYDNSQSYELDPNIYLSVYEYREKVIIPKISNVQEEFTIAIVNFFQGLFNNQPFVYPLRGFLELLYYPDKYLYSSINTFLFYLISYTIITVLYWVTLTPLYVGFFFVLGPLGVLLALVQTFLHANILTMMFMRLSHFANNIVKSCLDIDSTGTLPTTSIKYYVPISCTYFWALYLPIKILKYFLAVLILLILLTISAMPIIGPVLFHCLISPFITKIYISKTLKLKQLDNQERLHYFAQYFGAYTSFGLVAALLETIPILSGIILSTNVIGTTLLAVETILVTNETEESDELPLQGRNHTTTSTTDLLPELCRSSLDGNITELPEICLTSEPPSNNLISGMSPNINSRSGILLSGLCKTSEIPSINLNNATNNTTSNNALQPSVNELEDYIS
ncbi:similar to Saccharomyces cerevisiae YAL018C Putative protein of unknown function [Maudiozyma barnettii]|uniref:Uncharacterized protein n=1 Tax=Maudiozyma barnettii TaxID=61262 RepID=A0A8H2ZH35_9SACH|nr:Lds1p [Kazachstania barnettii]CAB4255309.1 similar to Saccharomyces cerevisiae YAL018C Putative protein of unknown function [Kazachstania barnettii]CAD1783716.1 similar to Saccharomyces cerevisiae YAL018C Putative protein of unknown function [Kazachstania barnettii]